MKHISPLLFLIISAVTTYLLSCDRDKPEPVPDCCHDCSCHYPCDDLEGFTYPYTDTLYQNDTFLSYWYFPVGSWWVYKRRDITADVFDTARVVDGYREIRCDCQLIGDKCVESMWMSIEHSSGELRKVGGKYLISTEIYINKCSSSGNIIADGVTHVAYPFVLGQVNGKTIYLTDTSKIKFRKFDFPKTITYDFFNPRINTSLRKRHVFVKNIGMVYMYHRDHSEWELWDYNVQP